MRRRRIHRSIIGLIAAYAIAIQTLLSGGAVIAHIAAAADICATHGDTNGSSGQQHGLGGDCPCGPACIMAACDAPVGVIGTFEIAINWPAIPGATLKAAALVLPATIYAVGGSNLPRAPPVA
jgi:hypothetical protein